MEVHKDFSFLEISWNNQSQAVEMSWKRFAKSEDFRAGLNEGLSLLEQKKSQNWLADLRELGVVK
ncbi:MAG: hypothetical protein HRT61_14695 [Ekhidna sp.]|nr:hypothetical protein [Ekhidna sp.]